MCRRSGSTSEPEPELTRRHCPRWVWGGQPRQGSRAHLPPGDPGAVLLTWARGVPAGGSPSPSSGTGTLVASDGAGPRSPGDARSRRGRNRPGREFVGDPGVRERFLRACASSWLAVPVTPRGRREATQDPGMEGFWKHLWIAAVPRGGLWHSPQGCVAVLGILLLIY